MTQEEASEDDELTEEDPTETTVTEADEVTNDDVEVQNGEERRSRALSTTSFDITACVEFPKNVSLFFFFFAHVDRRLHVKRVERGAGHPCRPDAALSIHAQK